MASLPNLPTSAYAGVRIGKKETQVSLLKEEEITHHKLPQASDLISWLASLAAKKRIKIVAAALLGEGDLKKLGSKLWLKLDIVPLAVNNNLDKSTEELVRFASNQFVDDVVNIRLGPDNKVQVAELATLPDYKKITKKEDIRLLRKFSDKFRNKKIVFFSATPRGGGVALMRHALMRLFKLIGVDASWHVMEESSEIFEITKKKFHNILHGIAPSSVKLNDKDKKVYQSWIEDNAKRLHSLFHESKVIVIDDPQPSGLVPYIRRASPKTKIIYRSHIQLETSLFKNSSNPQSLTWNYIWENIKSVDCFVSHPIADFVPHSTDKKKVVFMPATTDSLDGLNKPLSEKQKDYYFSLFNKFLVEEGQKPLDLERPYIVQIARFDPSKGIRDVVEAYRLLRLKLGKNNLNYPQLVIAGHGSIDDPEGAPILGDTMNLLKTRKYQTFAEDTKVARLSHVDQLLNVLLSESKIALQLSYKEGYEVKVSEALMKGIPVIAYDAGGIPLQIKQGVTGYLVKVGDTEKVAKYLYELLTDDEKYKKMSKMAEEKVLPDVNTVSNAIAWLYLANELVDKGRIKGNMQYVYDMAQR